MANLQASDSCLQTTWGAGQAKGSSLAAHGARKNGGGSKSAGKRLLKRAAKSSMDLDDYEEEQDHLDACFKDSDYGEPQGRAGPVCGAGHVGPGLLQDTGGSLRKVSPGKGHHYRHPGGMPLAPPQSPRACAPCVVHAVLMGSPGRVPTAPSLCWAHPPPLPAAPIPVAWWPPPITSVDAALWTQVRGLCEASCGVSQART